MHKLKQLLILTILAFPLMGKVALAEQVTDEVSNNNTSSSYLSLSVTSSSSSSSTGSDNPNLYLQAPEGGGIATGWHTLSVSTLDSSTYSYTLSMSISNHDGTTELLPESSTNATKISSVSDTKTDATVGIDNNNESGATLGINQWGYSLVKPDITSQETLSASKWCGLPSTSTSLMTASSLVSPSISANPLTIYYGARTNSLTTADTYTATVTYTVTAELVPPTISKVNGSTTAEYTIGSNTDSTIAIAGAGLINTTAITLADVTDSTITYECNDITVKSDNLVTCTIPTTIDEVSTYSLTVDTESGSDIKQDAVSYVEPSICKGDVPASGSTSVDGGDCQIDIDANMIPIVYVGSTDNAKWVKAGTDTVTDSDGNTWNSWFDYSNKQWANAVTVTSDTLEMYKNAEPGTEINNDDVLGYWVYIPRYSYEVMRPNAIDRYAKEQNFDIKFEKATDPVKTLADTCNILNPTAEQMWANGNADNVDSNILAKDYRTECGINRTYDSTGTTSTTWATHPAFTWEYATEVNGFDKTIELNGIWVGKYAVKGDADSPTIKEDGDAISSETIGIDFSIAKSLGVVDVNNIGGSTVSAPQNSNSLSSSKSHMMNNSEWGAIAYLGASLYGSSYNNHVNSTGNVYGFRYDVSSLTAYVASNTVFSNSNTSSTDNFGVASSEPYVNLYRINYTSRPNWSTASTLSLYLNDTCTWSVCGGDALIETKLKQSVVSGAAWGYGASFLASSADSWTVRSTTQFGHGGDAGATKYGEHPFRVTLASY